MLRHRVTGNGGTDRYGAINLVSMGMVVFPLAAAEISSFELAVGQTTSSSRAQMSRGKPEV